MHSQLKSITFIRDMRMSIVKKTMEMHEKCAVLEIIGRASDTQTGLEAAFVIYGLWALQHGGQESSGIASSDGKDIYRHAHLAASSVPSIVKRTLNGCRVRIAIGTTGIRQAGQAMNATTSRTSITRTRSPSPIMATCAPVRPHSRNIPRETECRPETE